MKLWQLKKISTNEALTEPSPLPENWGPIFGMSGFIHKINDLSWVGKPDEGWFEVGEIDEEALNVKTSIEEHITFLLKQTAEFVAADNTSITKQQRADWIEYRRLLKEMPLQPGYPNEVSWPKRPDAE